MMKYKEGVNLLEIVIKPEHFLKLPDIPVFVKKPGPHLEVPDEVISEQHDPFVEKNFVHLRNEKV